MKYLEAERMYYAKDTAACILTFKEAFNGGHISNVSQYLNAADKAYRLNEFEFSIQTLQHAIEKGASYSGIRSFLDRHPNLEITVDEFEFNSSDNSQSIEKDSLLIRDLLWLQERDQYARDMDESENSDLIIKWVDYTNFLLLKEIINLSGGRLPSPDLVGDEGQEAIELIVIHFDIEWIAEIFPALQTGICQGYNLSEDLIYQIERNIVDSGVLYVYDETNNTLIIDDYKIPTIDSSSFHYQYYGGYDFFSSLERKKIWWPFYANADLEKVNSLRRALCLDSIEELRQRKPYIIEIDNESFLKLFNYD